MQNGRPLHCCSAGLYNEQDTHFRQSWLHQSFSPSLSRAGTASDAASPLQPRAPCGRTQKSSSAFNFSSDVKGNVYGNKPYCAIAVGGDSRQSMSRSTCSPCHCREHSVMGTALMNISQVMLHEHSCDQQNRRSCVSTSHQLGSASIPEFIDLSMGQAIQHALKALLLSSFRGVAKSQPMQRAAGAGQGEGLVSLLTYWFLLSYSSLMMAMMA